ncbi:hypothetical protein EPO15_03245 [bacterium]|nr:MAG: hypothetical protein EPO15_03245 [bacterium]
MSPLRRRCCWCKADLGGPSDAPATDGVCGPCRKALIPSFLDTLPDATILVGDGVRVKSANAAARGEVGRELPDIEDRVLGEIFGCPHAGKPGGCPDPGDCAPCSVQVPVEDTLRNGTPHEDVPAVLRVESRYIPLYVTTRRVKGGVLLSLGRSPSD